MNLHEHHVLGQTRRHFLGSATRSFGAVALGSLLARTLTGEAFASLEAATAAPGPGGVPGPMTPRPPHFAPRAKRVIYLHMAGSPPQQDLLDYKPRLNEFHGKQAPASYYEGQRLAFIKGVPTLLGSPYQFEPVGPNGLYVSELLPHFKQIAGDVCVIRSMQTDQFNHAPAQLFLQTGFAQPGRPSMGSWLTYGLGSESDDLPAFIVLVSGGSKPSAGSSAWSSGFIPTIHSGVQCRTSGAPVLYLDDPEGMDRDSRRRTMDAINRLNRMQSDQFGDPETLTRIEQYELAFRMQTSVPEVMDISREPPAVIAEYGAEPGASSFANNCLLARRLSESGVRFVQLYDWGWDTHGTGPNDDLITQLPKKCRQTDQPIAALITDLKRRGLLDETLVIWSGEFGRTPMNEARNGSTFLGRDHHPGCFTVWMAGGGVKPGYVHGATDDFSYAVTENPVHVHDFHATVLHLLGLDHERLTHRFQGRDFRLTDVHGHVIHDIIA
jgi:hypothetical protein